MQASCQFYIAGDKLGFSTFDSLLLYLFSHPPALPTHGGMKRVLFLISFYGYHAIAVSQLV